MFPPCLNCNVGVLVPLSDYAMDGASVPFKAWACTNTKACKFTLRIDKGCVTEGRDVTSASDRDRRR